MRTECPNCGTHIAPKIVPVKIKTYPMNEPATEDNMMIRTIQYRNCVECDFSTWDVDEYSRVRDHNGTILDHPEHVDWIEAEALTFNFDLRMMAHQTDKLFTPDTLFGFRQATDAEIERSFDAYR